MLCGASFWSLHNILALHDQSTRRRLDVGRIQMSPDILEIFFAGIEACGMKRIVSAISRRVMKLIIAPPLLSSYSIDPRYFFAKPMNQ